MSCTVVHNGEKQTTKKYWQGGVTKLSTLHCSNYQKLCSGWQALQVSVAWWHQTTTANHASCPLPTVGWTFRHWVAPFLLGSPKQCDLAWEWDQPQDQVASWSIQWFDQNLPMRLTNQSTMELHLYSSSAACTQQGHKAYVLAFPLSVSDY